MNANNSTQLVKDRMEAILDAIQDDIVTFSKRFRTERLDRQEWMLCVSLDKEEGAEMISLQLKRRSELLEILSKARDLASKPITSANAKDMIKTLRRSVPNGHLLLLVQVPEGTGAKYVPLFRGDLN